MASSTHPEMELISRSNFAFSNALHEQLMLNGEEGNLVYSPFSLGLVLLMARFGARERTGKQLDRVLNPLDSTTKLLDELGPMRRGFFRVLKSLEVDRSDYYNVTVANRMFTGIGFNVQQEFKKISSATLYIKVRQLDLIKGRGRPAATAINAWVANKTNGKINGFVSPGSLRSQTQAVLVSTMHFKAPWDIPFDPEETRTASFHLNSNEPTQVSMMTSMNSYAYGDLHKLNATAVVIPYKGKRFSMHVYVPKEKDGLNDLLDALKNATMDEIRTQFKKPENCEEVHLSLPKFNIQSQLKLTEPLKEMGVEDVFSANLADLTGISDDANLYVSHVLQNSYIEVDEGGSGAAATPGIRAGLTCTPTVTVVNADRPFYFQIVDEQSDVVLIAGSVRDPRAIAKPVHPEVQLVTRNNFAFSNALHEQLRINGEGGNLVFSPFSLGMVLLMARFGARGRTAEQLDRVLNPIHSTAKKLNDLIPMRQGFFIILNSIQGDRSGDYNVIVANRMFTGTGFTIQEDFQSISKSTLDIKVKQLDFIADGGRPAAEAINSWVANSTNGNIGGIISPDSLTRQTQVVLVNTVHFKAPWKIPFDPAETRNATFHANSRKNTDAAMMTSEDDYSYGELEGMNAQAVVIPYKGNRFSMHVYIPNSKYGYGLNRFLEALKATSMDEIRGNISAPGNCESVRVSLPKFSIKSDLKLVQPLKQLGAPEMFSADRADLRGISEDANVYVSNIVQKALITVDEDGTEAAAAPRTKSRVFCSKSLKITEVIADRPFYFQIMDEEMGVVLLAGVVRDPSGTVKADVITAASAEAEDSLDDTAARLDKSMLRRLSAIPAASVKPTTVGTTADIQPKIVFATLQAGIKAYSEGTDQVEPMVGSTENLYGVAWDPVTQHLYFCSREAIYRLRHDGSNVQTVFNTTNNDGALQALAVDWITGNLYGVTSRGDIFACSTKTGESLSCVTVLSGQGRLHGIAVDPNKGTMYCTVHYDKPRVRGSILMAGLDGSSHTDIVTGLQSPGGIVIDHASSKIFWTDHFANQIQSSDLDGRNVQEIIPKLAGKPYGIALHKGKLTWGNYDGKTLQSFNKSGGDIETVYSAGSSITHLVLMAANFPNVSRQNDCDGQTCPKICVLTPTSSRCID